MKRIPEETLQRMAALVSEDDRDEMAIPSYLHSNPALRWMAWRRIEEMARFIRRFLDGPDNVVVDFGCGTGVLFEELVARAKEVIGVDLVLEPARLWVEERQLDSVRLLSPDKARTQLPAQSVNAIVAAEVLEHIEPLGPTLALFRDMLKPSGRLLVSVPTENTLYRFGRRMAGFENHYHESNASAIHQQILESGFRQQSMSKIPAPGPLAIYWVLAYERA